MDKENKHAIDPPHFFRRVQIGLSTLRYDGIKTFDRHEETKGLIRSRGTSRSVA